MRIAFTLCSINYLAQAKTLGDSLLRHNPGYRFVIGVVDRNDSNVDLKFLGTTETLFVDELKIDGFAEMAAKYNIIELVTSVKPFYFAHLFGSHPDAESVAYFDPDIKVFQPLTRLENSLTQHPVVLTPHFTSPIDDDKTPTEKHVMNTGVFNLGFAAMRRGDQADKLIQWWMKKLRHECLADLPRGYFVDQLWMNLAPAFVENLLIEKHPGYNTAHWNLHERTLSKGPDGRHLVNGQELVFYHFSHYSPRRPDVLASHHTRFSFATRRDVVELYEEYRSELVANGYLKLIDTPCAYVENERRKRATRAVTGWLRQNLPVSAKIKANALLKRVGLRG